MDRRKAAAVALVILAASLGLIFAVQMKVANERLGWFMQLLALSAFGQGEGGEYWLDMSDEELNSILTVKYVDEADWTEEETPEELKEPRVNLPSTNITSISLGVKGEYLYIKVEFEGVIPEQPPKTEEGGYVLTWTFTILMDVDNDTSTGWHGIDVLVGAVKRYNSDEGFGHGMVYNVPSIPDEEEAMRQADELLLRYKGGLGYNYVVLEVPMEKAGLQPGQTVIVDIHAEAESEEFHHYTFDALTAHNATYSGPDHPAGYVQQIVIPTG